MISPDELFKKALRFYHARFLSARLSGDSPFPLTIPCAKGKATDPMSLRMDTLAALMSREKTRLGYGYRVRFREVQTRKSGVQSVPDVVFFETDADFLSFIGKTAEVKAFDRDVSLIRGRLPELIPWVYENPMQVIRQAGIWENLIRVCRYFNQTPRPDLYIRELPIDVHTKFIEENKGILTALLDNLLPVSMVLPEEKRFELRFGLKYDQALIRFRLIDPALGCCPVPGLADISLPVSDFASLDLPCERAFIVENKMNFLTFPRVENSIVIWGRGFAVEQLQTVTWLSGKSLFYWGDIDPHGFEILSLLRRFFPETRSILMDAATFEHFSRYAVTSSPARSDAAAHLSPEEEGLHRRLLALPDHNRLEQEKIPQSYVVSVLNTLGG